jgi:hypothetical protein
MANFKAPGLSQDDIILTKLCKDPEYIKHVNEQAEEEQMMSMLEKNLEPC